jgi:arginyl-tRNA synthetase
MDTRAVLRKSVKRAVENLVKMGRMSAPSFNMLKITRSQRPDQGDYSANIAMQIAAFNDKKPKTVAKIIADELKKDEKLAHILKDIRVAPPGFVNFYLDRNYLRKLLLEALQDEAYGSGRIGKGKKINLEFVSVNPTGELHIGHGRTAFYGDVLANILAFSGYEVTREYYVNNARQSAQIKELGKTALRRGTSYKSPYLDKKISESSSSLEKLKSPEAAGYFLASKIQKDTKEFLIKKAAIKFDVWTEEEKLYKTGAIERTLQTLKAKGLVYEADGAVWLKTTRYGDSQDQVLVRSSGENTYFLADTAYHQDKANRGFDKLIDIWGADHQGHLKRMRAVGRILGIKNFEILISQLVTLKGRLRLSKRKGNIVSLQDLLDAVGQDAARYFYLTKSLDSQMEFDLRLAKKQSQSNPVYYIQYTHARICSILRKSQMTNGKPQISSTPTQAGARAGSISVHCGAGKNQITKKDLEMLGQEGEFELIRKLVVFPEIIEDISQDYQVHRLATYIHELAQQFNQFYRDFRVLGDNEKTQAARLALTAVTGTIINKGLELLGIYAPQRM